MTTRVKTITAAVTGAVVLASAAYALGSQAGGGSATATGTRAAGEWHGRHHGPFRGAFRAGAPDLSSFAAKLGVTEAKLRAALDALPPQRQDDLASRLATALGVDPSRVTSALDTLKPPDGTPPPPGMHAGARGAFIDALAAKLGLDPAKVRSALRSLTPQSVEQAGGKVPAVAKALGVDEAKVRDALQGLRPFGHRGPGGPGPFADLSTLAGKIGVTPAQLRAAFQKLRAQKRDDFATALAQKLGIDPQKVKDALPAGQAGFHARRFGP